MKVQSKSTLLVSRESRVRAHLRQHGWARFNLAENIPVELDHTDLRSLAIYSQDLPLDQFGGSRRYRAYAEGEMDPRRRTITWRPGRVNERGGEEIDYVQSSEFQPEHGDEIRTFQKICDHVLSLPLVSTTMWFDYGLTPFADELRPVTCGFHLINLRPAHGQSARVTPDCFHQDGQPYTAVHLVQRDHVQGGITYVAPPVFVGHSLESVSVSEMTGFTLDAPLDSYVVNDLAVVHYVSAVEAISNVKDGCRIVMLIDFVEAAVDRPANIVKVEV